MSISMLCVCVWMMKLWDIKNEGKVDALLKQSFTFCERIPVVPAA